MKIFTSGYSFWKKTWWINSTGKCRLDSTTECIQYMFHRSGSCSWQSGVGDAHCTSFLSENEWKTIWKIIAFKKDYQPYVDCLPVRSCFCQLHTWKLKNGAVPLYHCTAVPLYRCTAVPLYRCTAVPLYHCTAVPLYRCTTVPLYNCTAVPLYRCTAGFKIQLRV